jgi:hypothetical protein
MPRNIPVHSIEFPDSETRRAGSGFVTPFLLLATLGVGLTLLSDSSGGPGVSGAIVNLAAATGNIFGLITSSIWNAAMSLAQVIIARISDSFMHSSGGLSTLFPDSGGWIESTLAMTLCAMILLGISGPIYAAWKSWRVDRAHRMN